MRTLKLPLTSMSVLLIGCSSCQHSQSGTVQPENSMLAHPIYYSDAEVVTSAQKIPQIRSKLPARLDAVLVQLGLLHGSGMEQATSEDAIHGRKFTIYRVSPNYLLVTIRPYFQPSEAWRYAAEWSDATVIQDLYFENEEENSEANAVRHGALQQP